MISDVKMIALVDSLPNPFDYSGYVNSCEREGISPIPKDKYAQKLGMLLMAKFEHPDIDSTSAYMAFIKSFQKDVPPPKVEPVVNREVNTVPKPSGCCGGGEVR